MHGNQTTIKGNTVRRPASVKVACSTQYPQACARVRGYVFVFTRGFATIGVATIGVATIGVGTIGVATIGVATIGVATIGVATIGVATII